MEGQDELSDCRECHAGKACTQVALKAPDVDCMQGFVCPLGSTKPNLPTNACPAGTQSNRTDLTHRSQCQMCPARYACLRGTGGPQRPPLSCFAGHYCPPGSKFPSQFKCPMGTWSGHSGLESESECQPCPAGWYCLAGSGSPSGRCSSGHYCPAGTAYGTQFPCPAGTFSIHMGSRQKEDCLICPDGSFCREGTSKPSPCPPSTFRRQKGGQTPEDCSACPAGYFCSRSATVNPRVCGAGSFSDEGSVECSPCLPGYYCSNETTSEEAMRSIMVCPAGFLCSQGLSRDPQRSATLCPVGFFCPGGGIDPNPVPCPNGTYGESPGLQNVAQCRPCPAGMYCYAERPLEQPITRPTGVCPDGHYCPSGTGYPQTYPCQAGFYSSISVGHSGKECVSCPAQHYCGRPGVHTPARCPQGFFCPVGTSRPHPCPEGTYGSRPALSDQSECTPCGGGRYCSGVGLTGPSGDCQQRFYCREGATSATPIDGSTGGLCPAGSYCPPASSAPFPCPPGSFSNNTGLTQPQDCTPCPPGFYCLGSGNTAPSGPCSPGFYCSGGASSPVQFEAGEGHYSLGGAVRAEPCPLGTFQSSRGTQSCVGCLRGRLCNRTGWSLPPLCPPGHYCPPGTSVAHPCPPGSYLDQSGGDDVQRCRQCEAGWFCNGAGLSAPQGLCEAGHYCTAGASTPTPVDVASGGVCPAGYVCPRGTKFPHQHPCPPGTWSGTAGAHNLTYCQKCPPGRYCSGAGLTGPSGVCDAGFFCIQGARTPTPSDGVAGNICPVGHYCSKGSSSPRVCPDGTFSNSTGAEACADCPPGTYCLSGEGVRPCPAGHFCLGGGVEAILPCPPGTYSPQIGLSQVEQCLMCPAGFYCEDWGLFEPTGPCQAGYYCTAGVNFLRPDGNFSTGVGGACPRGKYCPEGTGLPVPCPPGTSSHSLHLTDSSGCSSCPGGMFCSGWGLTSPTGTCVAGFYCPGGDSSATGSDVCPPAHYCPEGTLSPIPCPAGSFANRTGHAVCQRCPAGYYCPEKTQSFMEFPCPPGFYCPDGTRHASQYPCPRGYYNPEPMTQSLDSCLPCPPGHYCEKERLTRASGKCKGGWFCVSAAWNSQPFDLDNYTNANCLCPATSTGGRCQAGFYCPSGSSEPLPCPPGAFCNISGLALPTGPCSAGFYCAGGATDARPTDGDTGNICPPGTFCVEGSGEPELCPAGTFSPVAGLTGEAGCRRCTAGFYCGEPGLRAPTGPCSVGYWCPSGQSLATALPCPVGHFCPQGASSPRPCPPGTYQDRERQESCSLCWAGFSCDSMTSQSNVSLPKPCPSGHYCPLGTSAPKLHPCPKGTFNPLEGSESMADCLLCSRGEFCPSAGLTQPAGACHAGYWCRTGSSSPTPLDEITGSLCPAGHFCPTGALAPEACPEGSWSNSSGLRGEEQCKPCPGGHFCDSRGSASPTGPCHGGYYCLSGASSSTPTDGVTGGPCPEGHYCPEGSVEPLPCQPGTYTVVTHATRCEPCMAGWHCRSRSFYLCPAGFFCPEGTGLDPKSCPEGTYGPDRGYSSVSECRRCDGGHYCSSRNATAVTGPCQAGYYCSGGNSSPRPQAVAAAEQGGPCPAGHYCPEATAHPLPCPRGTFSNLTKLASKDQCQPCFPGYYCDAVALLAPTGKCRAGFFCLEGASRPDPPGEDGHGGPCPKGHYCPEASPAPQPCPAGAVSAQAGQPSCSTCPPGFYCPGGVNGSLDECPVGHYCPAGTRSKHQHPCPAGFINPGTQKATPLDCLRCPPGLFCASPGLSAASGACGAGYYCLSGAWSPTPSDGETGDSCPEGHYCPQGSSSPLPCPEGYYSNTTGNSIPSDCLPCPPGHLCFSRGLPFPSQVCPAGSFCPGGGDGSTASVACSAGNMCPAGSSQQVPCPPGTYQNSPGQEECLRCPAGFYCDGSAGSDTSRLSGTQQPTLCPKGHYCPPGAESAVAFPCPAGTFSGQMGLSSISGCEPCPPGSYCASFGLAAPTGACSPGYLCLLRSLSSQPGDGATGGRCAAGWYCPQGTSYMVPCPAGTFSSVAGAVNLEACQLCLPGHYCAEDGLSSPSGPCKPGFFCTVGSPTATPLWNISVDGTCPSSNSGVPTLGRYHGDVCPAGHFCPGGSEKPSPCPPGTFQGKQGAESEEDCRPCYPGFYCPSWAQTSVDHLCPAGWFCGQGSASGRQPGFRCDPGYACPSGSAEPVICRPGTFQSSFGEATCGTCPAGFYCTEGAAAPCPCPVGTFSPLTGSASLSDCVLCTSGFFCNASAITEPSGPCGRGHFCALGSTESNPIARPHGDVCPVGHFCPLGSGSPKPCPVGSFLSATGAFSPHHCQPCPPGRYCLSLGAARPTGPCAAGFFCSTGSDSSTPSTGPALFHCLHEVLRVYSSTDDILSTLNSSSPSPDNGATWAEREREPATYSDHSETRVVTSQYGCNAYKGDICPRGFYCPLGSAYPVLCEAGFHCNQSGLERPAGPCDAGFYCPTGSLNPTAQPCPAGHYCPSGAPLPVPCPLGTIQRSVGGSAAEDCLPCPPGRYCNHRASLEPGGQCSEGFYCPGGQSSEQPLEHLCSPGHYCAKGSVAPSACPPGSYQPRAGQASCEPCPAGFLCQDAGTTLPRRCAEGFYCPSESAVQHPCPSGRYGNMTGLFAEHQCLLCDPGMFCSGTGKTGPSGQCAAGFVCVGGASEPSPSDGRTGLPCPPGFFCSAGTFVPQPCPKGTFSEKSGLTDESQCQSCRPGFYCAETGLSAVSGPCVAGFYCLEGSHTAAPGSGPSGRLCPIGHYCAQGSSVASPCPPGSYQNETGGKAEADCKPCPLGFFQELSGQRECNPCPPGFHCLPQSSSPSRVASTGLSSPLPCPAGYVCPRTGPESRPVPCPKGTYSPALGLSSSGECLLCPAGSFCGSEGLAQPSGACVPGFICLAGATVPNPNDTATGSLCPPGLFCKLGHVAGDCWAGHYCNRGSSRPDQALCPAGFFCPVGTPAPVPCPAGTFSSVAGNTREENCTACSPGFYCPVKGTIEASLCPAGHYCPPGLVTGNRFPCPAGTMNPHLGASSPDACEPCPSGMFCSQPGQSQPTGPCEAGFYCPAGSSRSNSTEHQDNSSQTHVCPPGHYCPQGTGFPLPCPAGSLSSSRGLRRRDECLSCPSGRFCRQPGMVALSEAPPCDAGYVCLSGSPSPTPSDGSHGYLCPAGHRCPAGSATELPCEPGTYSLAPGAAECRACPSGTVCSSFATREPATCPAGHYCPAGAALPLPCPLGTLSNGTGANTLTACTACPAGAFCNTLGASTPQGKCLQGYFCQGGAQAPAPHSSDSFPLNGACPVGHYCPEGCLAPVPCPFGSVRNTTGGVSVESCLNCPAGHYCSSEGLVNPNGPCAAGFFCPFDFSSTTPYAFLCLKGHYCPTGSPMALPCPTGEYQPNPGSDRCIPCRPGFYCEEAVAGDPHLCPPHSFCPAGTMVPRPCPDGTYTPPNKTGLLDERECCPCPPGKFCRAGRIQGVCAAGHLCLSGSAEFTPPGPIPNVSQCQWGVACAGPCPPGFYCPEGTEGPQICPENTFRGFPGAANLLDCLACPPTHWCKQGDPFLHLCPAGHYCDALPGSDFHGVTGPKACPLHSYRASPGAGSRAECLPCPPGFHCNNTGLSDYTSSPCPPGYWCSGVGSPVLCPAGTKRSTPGAGSPRQCEPCGGGTFCPDPTATGKPNVDGTPCRASYECPTGAASERLCRAGSYCGPQTAEPQTCPEGYICPEGSDSYDSPKQLCPFPYYCPANSSAMKSCHEGTMPVHVSGPRGSRSSSCALCEGGTYRPYRSPNLQCLHCPAGYFCPAGTGDYRSSPCPFGYVCPVGSDRPTPCPPGSFGNITQAESSNDCHACPTNTFNHLPGRKACFPCGSSSTSPPGSTSCSCLGKNRAFHPSDGLCLCRTGFIYYNLLDFKSSASDSELDCQPEMNRRCATGEVRLAASRECVSPSRHSCNRTCGPHGGSLNAEMGICQCAKYVSSEELCNTSCLSRLAQLSAQPSPDGSLLLSIGDRGAAVWSRTVKNVLGPDVHAKNIWTAHLVQFDSEGIFGWIPAREGAVDRFLSEGSNSRQRRDVEHTEGDGLPRIPNPIVCVSVDDMLLFHLTINHADRHLSHFPVYYKDHLFNSNPGWDSGVFRQLETLITQSSFNSTMFAHVFSERGKYVFLDASVPDWSLVVVVSEEGTECDPRNTAFQPMTPSQLLRYGVVKQHGLNLLPNWDVITGVLCLLLVLVVVLTTMVLVLRPSKVALVTQWRSRPKWRSLGEPIGPVECVCSRESRASSWAAPSLGSPLTSRGVGEGAEAEEHSVSRGGSVLKFSNLEGFNVKTLYDKLEDQNLHIAAQLARHRKDTQEFYSNICQQVETLQNFFEKMDHKKLGLLKELLVHNAMMDKPKADDQAEASAALLEAVLRSVEVLLCRLSLETELSVASHAQAGVVHGREPQNPSAEPHMSDPQRSSVTKTDALPQEHNFPKPSGLSDPDLSKLVSASPLYKTLLEIQDYLKNVSASDPFQLPCDGPTVEEDLPTELVPTALDKLSPQHSAIFLFGCQVMELLSSCAQFPSVLLLLAKSIPVSSALSNKGLLAHCSGDCYFDATNQILYLLEAQLQSAGHFIAALVQSMAYIASGFQTSGYLLSLHEAIAALSLQLFFSSKWSSTECKSGATSWSCGDVVEELLNITVPTEEHFTEQLMAARLEKYKYFTLEQLISNFKESSTEDGQKGRTPRGTPLQVAPTQIHLENLFITQQVPNHLQTSCIEEEIDRMNESFVRLSMELQQRRHLKVKQNEEAEDSSHWTGATAVSTPRWSRDGTALLELKRRYISQRLTELQLTLSQHRDGESEEMSDGVQTGGAERERLPGVDGCWRSTDPCQGDISGRESQSQRGGPGNLSGDCSPTPDHLR
ncbi:SCO-spondin isoform X1 [Synchiropus splendidus]|uniref:SCO-spondin isoform X1 n=1 Tax=Synchiropus splendidus TaxID=270530 RepID=UPI00237DD20A|nr:SCO-spondin isoform X1 [Synchiropus splendidus]